MAILITNDEKLIKAPCTEVFSYEDAESVCTAAVERAEASGSKSVGFCVRRAAAGGLSATLDAILCAFGDDGACRDAEVDVYVLVDAEQETDNIEEELERFIARPVVVTQDQVFGEYGDKLRPEFEEYAAGLKGNKIFAEYLNELIENKGVKKYSDLYKASGISKSTFSKIMNFDRPHRPSKGTVAALAIGLALNIDEAQELYNAAGYYLGFSEPTDKIVRFFIHKQIYDIDEVNFCLFYYGLPILGERVRECSFGFKR